MATMKKTTTIKPTTKPATPKKASPAVTMATKVKTAAPKPTPKATVKPDVKAAEAEFKKLIKGGKVKDLEKARRDIQKKYGVRPNGMTN